MRCPYCQSEDTQVKDSRPAEDGAVIRRRRVCSVCGGRFTTFERVQLRDLMVVKKSGRRVPFDRDKLTRSIEVALRKRDVTVKGWNAPFPASCASLKVPARRR
ncbi:transcriptional regulator NrdR [Brucella melitensis]|nr:transcriptional regulator NrdR [Brucella melitensis]